MLIADCLLWLIAALLFIAIWYAARRLGGFGSLVAGIVIITLALIGLSGTKPLITVVPCGSKYIAKTVTAGLCESAADIRGVLKI